MDFGGSFETRIAGNESTNNFQSSDTGQNQTQELLAKNVTCSDPMA